MRKFFTVFILLAFQVSFGQDYSGFTNTIEKFYSLDPSGLDEFWRNLSNKNSIPLIVEDSVAFLYRGEARTVAWLGDFNAWGFDKKIISRGQRIPGTDVWILKASFPVTARMDYKIQLDGFQWIIDPENPHQQWSGVGGGSPNSEIRMPQWKEDPILQSKPGTPQGVVKHDILFFSHVLGYQVMYSTYTPHGIHHFKDLPIIYVTDGYEYLHPKLGNMTAILDNLIAEKKIKPIVVVFIDHREPVNRVNNRRMEELTMSPRYIKFFVDEFVPSVEKKLGVHAEPLRRGIMGNSIGGLNAAYFAFTRPDVFGLAGIQSPSFGTRPQIYSLCDNPNSPKIRVSMTSGIINDASDGTRKMKTILENNACVYNYKEVNEGHSWGNWRNLIDDILIDFFSPK